MDKTRRMDVNRETVFIRPDDLFPYERNAKLHDEKQIKNIARSISRFGWWQPLVVTKDNVVVVGHGRRLAAQK